MDKKNKAESLKSRAFDRLTKRLVDWLTDWQTLLQTKVAD